MGRKTIIRGLGMLVLVTGVLFGQGAPTAPAQDAAKDFQARVKKYLDLRKFDAGTSPRPTDSPEKLVERQRHIAGKVRELRPAAKQGEIFTPEIATYFRQQIAAALAGANGAKVRASLRHAEPLPKVRLQPNQTYPQKVPLQSVPPTLLQNLPTLPKELQYRILGRDLALHDTGANLIVDFVPNAIPPA